MNKTIKLILYDTTLRDGAQTPGLNFSLVNKIKIAERLDSLGFSYIEGGWPGANKTDTKFFEEAKKLKFKKAKLVAFGMTAKMKGEVCQDPGLQVLAKSKTQIVTIFGKSWLFHVQKTLKASPLENLQKISETITFLRKQEKRVFYDAEHFYDGYKNNPKYALATLLEAKFAGAEIITLCDTNGGSIPEFISQATIAAQKILGKIVLGIHAHNDGGLANANTLAAIKAGATLVQGTINGLGERTGNLDFCEFLPTAQFKYHYQTGINLKKLTQLSKLVEEESRFLVPFNKPYVGRNAFCHKAGVHVDAMKKNENTYQHIKPSLIGSKTTFEHSDQGGKANILMMAEKHGFKLPQNNFLLKTLVVKMKKLRVLGDAQEFLLLYQNWQKGTLPFEVLPGTKVVISKGSSPKATVKIRVNGDIYQEAGFGRGALHAFDLVLKKALRKKYPQVNQIHLLDYKVDLPMTEKGTEASIIVYIEFGVNGHKWTSITYGTDEQTANQEALIDAYQYWILKNN